jgi:hypothetical protein
VLPPTAGDSLMKFSGPNWDLKDHNGFKLMVTFASLHYLNEHSPPTVHPFEPPPPPAVGRFFVCVTNHAIDTFDWTLEHVENI